MGSDQSIETLIVIKALLFCEPKSSLCELSMTAVQQHTEFHHFQTMGQRHIKSRALRFAFVVCTDTTAHILRNCNEDRFEW